MAYSIEAKIILFCVELSKLLDMESYTFLLIIFSQLLNTCGLFSKLNRGLNEK